MNKELLDEKLKNREQLILQQNEKISALEKEIKHLKDDGPDWYYKDFVDQLKQEIVKLKCGCQHDDPSWCDPNTCMVPRRKLDQRDERLKVLEQENDDLREGLEKIFLASKKALDERILGHPQVEAGAMEDFEVTLEATEKFIAKYPNKGNRSVMGEQK